MGFVADNIAVAGIGRLYILAGYLYGYSVGQVKPIVAPERDHRMWFFNLAISAPFSIKL